MSPRRFLTDQDRYPWRPLRVIALSVAVMLTAVCGGGGWTPRIPRTPFPPPPDLSRSVPWNAFALSPDGVRVAAQRTSSGVLVYEWQARSNPVVLEDISSCYPGVSRTPFSPDGSLLVYTCMKGKLLVWDTRTGKQIFTSPCGFGNWNPMAWSHDGHRLATVCNDNIVVWDVITGKKVTEFRAVEKSVRISSLAFTRSGEIYSGDFRGWVRQWNDAGKELRSVTFNREVSGMLLSPDEKELAVIQRNPDSSGPGKEVVLWDSATGLKRRLRAVEADLPKLLSFSPDGKLLMLRIEGGRVSIFSTVSNRYVETLGSSERVMDAVFRSDGTIVAIVGGQIRTWRCCGR